MKTGRKAAVFAMAAVLCLMSAGCSKEKAVVTQLTPMPSPTAAITGAIEDKHQDNTPEVTDTVTPILEPVIETPELTDEEIAALMEANYVLTVDDVFDEYDDFLREYVENNEDIDIHKAGFALALIDDDEMPELLVAKDNYHACGVQVYKYFGPEDVRFVGEFGEYGGFAYTKQKNLIISFYMGMGVASTTFYSIGEDGTAVLLKAFETVENDDGGTVYAIDSEKVSEVEYASAIEEYYRDDRTLVSLDTMTPLYDGYVNNIMAIYRDMYAVLKEGTEYTGYHPAVMEDMIGEWDMFAFDIYEDASGMNGYYPAEGNASAWVGIDDDYLAGFWFSGYYEDEPFYSSYCMKMTFLEAGIADGLEQDEYCVRLDSDDFEDNNDYYVTTYTDENGEEVLILCMFMPSETTDGINHIYAYCHRETEEG